MGGLGTWSRGRGEKEESKGCSERVMEVRKRRVRGAVKGRGL